MENVRLIFFKYFWQELDEFNAETFGDDVGGKLLFHPLNPIEGDWELEHEKFLTEFGEDDLPPSPCEIPKFWENANLADFWSAGDLDVSQSFDAVSHNCIIITIAPVA